MKLLLLCMNYAPERTGIAPFTTDLAEYLARRGHEVTVATTFPHYPEWETHADYSGKWSVQETRNGVTIQRRRIWLPRRATTLRRILYDTSLGVMTLWAGLRTRAMDLVLAVEPPIQAGIAARILAQRKHIPYVLWVQDLALEAAMSVGMMRANRALRLGQSLEQWSHARAQKIIVISQGFVENLRRKGVPSDKLFCLPNWVNVQAVRPEEKGNGFRKTYGIRQDALLVLYSGNMGVKQNLENVLQAAGRLKCHSEIAFALVGDGSQKNMLVEMAQRQGLDNVRLIPLQPLQEVAHMMAAADILLLNQHPDLVEAVIPSKLLTYMAAARPIVIAAHPDSEAARQVQSAACGIRVAPNDPDALVQAIVSLASVPAARAALGERGRAFVEKNFARERLLQRYESVLADSLN
jgi:colanic acid biosynthesis glycosyl transferase WcaI